MASSSFTRGRLEGVIYPLSASAAPQSTFIDMADTVWDAVARFDQQFLYEPRPNGERKAGSAARCLEMTGMLRMLGLGKSQELNPTSKPALH